MKLIELALTMAYDAKVNFGDVFYQVRMWDCIIYNYLKKRNIVIPPKERTEKDTKYAGAYVKEPIPGVYDWVVSFDLIVCILTLLCSTISRQRHWLRNDIPLRLLIKS